MFAGTSTGHVALFFILFALMKKMLTLNLFHIIPMPTYDNSEPPISYGNRRLRTWQTIYRQIT
ncbi:hypothetical protein D3C84_924060 [compost metagenome]